LVHIRVRPSIAVKRYVVNQGGVEWSNIEDTKVTISVTEMFYAAYKIDRVDMESMDINVFNELTSVMANAHMIEEEKFVLSMAPALAKTAITMQDCSSTNADKFLDMLSLARVALEREYVLSDTDQPELFVVVPPEVGYVIRKMTINSYNTSGVENRGARYAELPPLMGFRVLVSPFVVGTGASSSPYKCIAGTKDAISFARKIVETGVNVDLPNSFERGIKSLNVFGGTVTAPPALVYLPVQTK
jgi:hypothetical protein